jgi:hypothetical protein
MSSFMLVLLLSTWFVDTPLVSIIGDVANAAGCTANDVIFVAFDVVSSTAWKHTCVTLGLVSTTALILIALGGVSSTARTCIVSALDNVASTARTCILVALDSHQVIDSCEEIRSADTKKSGAHVSQLTVGCHWYRSHCNEAGQHDRENVVDLHGAEILCVITTTWKSSIC